MTQKSRFWTTNDTGDGPAAGYTAQDFADVLRRLLTTDQEAGEGVLRGVDDELAVTGTSSPLSVASGAAVVYGYQYDNSTALNLTVASPTTGTTGGRVNLKADWATQTVRAVAQLNTDGNPAIPALVQTPGSEWSIPLATFTITTAGVVVLTDARQFCHFATQLAVDMIEALAAYSVVGRSASGSGAAEAIEAADNTVLRLLSGVLGFGTITAAMIAAGAVTGDKIAADAVSDEKAGDRVPQLPRRQGGSATDWSVYGSTNYTPGAVRIQAGVATVSIADGASSGSAGVTFPVAFSNRPIVLLANQGTANLSYSLTLQVRTTQADTFTLYAVRTGSSGALSNNVSWIAIGPE